MDGVHLVARQTAKMVTELDTVASADMAELAHRRQLAMMAAALDKEAAATAAPDMVAAEAAGTAAVPIAQMAAEAGALMYPERHGAHTPVELAINSQI